MIDSPKFRAFLFVLGFLMQVAVELLRWLADMPAETATGLTSLSWLAIGGPAALAALAARRNNVNDQRGQARVSSLVIVTVAFAVFALAFVALGAGGCAPRHVIAEQSVEVDIQRGPPCQIVVKADGELVARVDWSKRCEVSLPEAVTP